MDAARHHVAPRRVPTHSELMEFMLALLPPHPRDVPLLYHTPRYPSYDQSRVPINDMVFSITPTAGVYTKLSQLESLHQNVKPACFLHRPFNLDRKAVPRGTIVFANHKRFDELLTTGWNTALATSLNLDIPTAACIQGYKGDPDRRIGLVAKLYEPQSLRDIYSAIQTTFGAGDIFPNDPEKINLDSQIGSIAIMNAFGADEVSRAVSTATGARFIENGEHSKLLYLTGEPKDLGLQAMCEVYAGMVAVCVGHREAEEWGIRYLAACVKHRWGAINVHTVFEAEEPIPRPNGVVKDVTVEQTGEQLPELISR